MGEALEIATRAIVAESRRVGSLEVQLSDAIISDGRSREAVTSLERGIARLRGEAEGAAEVRSSAIALLDACEKAKHVSAPMTAAIGRLRAALKKTEPAPF
jgi:hypothetical protein